MNQEINNDKRRYIRYEVLDCARVLVDGHDPFQSVVVDIGLGGLQLRGLRRELVDTKKMTEKAFHDEIMRQGSMPISLLKLALSQTLVKGSKP